MRRPTPDSVGLVCGLLRGLFTRGAAFGSRACHAVVSGRSGLGRHSPAVGVWLITSAGDIVIVPAAFGLSTLAGIWAILLQPRSA